MSKPQKSADVTVQMKVAASTHSERQRDRATESRSCLVLGSAVGAGSVVQIGHGPLRRIGVVVSTSHDAKETLLTPAQKRKIQAWTGAYD